MIKCAKHQMQEAIHEGTHMLDDVKASRRRTKPQQSMASNCSSATDEQATWILQQSLHTSPLWRQMKHWDYKVHMKRTSIRRRSFIELTESLSKVSPWFLFSGLMGRRACIRTALRAVGWHEVRWLISWAWGHNDRDPGIYSGEGKHESVECWGEYTGINLSRNMKEMKGRLISPVPNLQNVVRKQFQPWKQS